VVPEHRSGAPGCERRERARTVQRATPNRSAASGTAPREPRPRQAWVPSTAATAAAASLAATTGVPVNAGTDARSAVSPAIHVVVPTCPD
jgi:hypothetical protein